MASSLENKLMMMFGGPDRQGGQGQVSGAMPEVRVFDELWATGTGFSGELGVSVGRSGDGNNQILGVWY